MNIKEPIALIILDGWGIAPDSAYNAISQAYTPFIDSLFAKYPHTQLSCTGENVGLPNGQMGNSEVGHLNIGAGRIIYQDISRIDLAIKKKELENNSTLLKIFTKIKNKNKTLHLLGLVSDGGVHSSMNHLYALIKAAENFGIEKILIHAFLDGRDTPPNSGIKYIKDLQTFIKKHPKTKIATLGGRYWGMDRDKRWDRIKKHYEALVFSKGPWIKDPLEYIKSCYNKKEYDEFIIPAVILDNTKKPIGKISSEDSVLFFNFRADRSRELAWTFNSKNFKEFKRDNHPLLDEYLCMTEYDKRLKLPVIFPPQNISNTLSEIISKNKLRQLHIAETEKYAHVTFFLNGGKEEPFQQEDRILIPSPKEVETYDKKPEMSANYITNEIIKNIEKKTNPYDIFIINYANCDMLGHTGILKAALSAIETIDKCLKKIIPYFLSKGGKVLLTSDHGNAEQMFDLNNNSPYTAHTVSNPVPFILIDQKNQRYSLNKGKLCDVAPTLLDLININKPPEMTGQSLIKK